jgi:uncharacterized membrane protein YdjX (TVP38/TMEM64 family)
MDPYPASEDSGGRWTRRVVIVVGIAIIAYLVWTIWDYDRLMQWIADARPVPFFVAMAALPAVGLPLTPFYLLAGATFDAGVALVGTALALSANLAFCYFVGRSSLRRRLVSLFERFGYELPDFDAETGRSTRQTVRFTMLVKLAPGVPGFVKHYGLGAARVPFAIYMGVGIVASAGYAIALIILGDSLFSHDLGPGAIAILVLAVAALALWSWSRRRARGREAATAAGA